MSTTPRFLDPPAPDPLAPKNSPRCSAGERKCEECGGLVVSKSGKARFCTAKCRYRDRDRRRYAADPDGERTRSLQRYVANREHRLETGRRYREARGVAVRHPEVKRVCPLCGLREPASLRHTYCEPCSEWKREQRRGRESAAVRVKSRERKTFQSRRYGVEHQRFRAAWKREVDAGGVTCSRCGFAIMPGSKWDLGHADGGEGYHGPEHSRCNRSAGGRQGAIIRNFGRPRKRRSREW